MFQTKPIQIQKHTHFSSLVRQERRVLDEKPVKIIIKTLDKNPKTRLMNEKAFCEILGQCDVMRHLCFWFV